MSTVDFVERSLRFEGFDVRRIPTGHAKTPDLLVADQERRYLIEVKDKFSDEESQERRMEVLLGGDIWDEEEALGYQNVVSRTTREAAKQLSCFSGEPIDFRLVWLHARGRHPDNQLSQFKATLFGSVDLVDLAEIDGSVRARPCFYFGFSEFFRLRDVLDGAIIAIDEKGLLCVNALSPRYVLFRRSALYTAFREGICDPLEREQNGEAYIADCEIGRRDEAAVLEYVKNKYGRRMLQNVNPKHYSAEMIVPERANDEAT